MTETIDIYNRDRQRTGEVLPRKTKLGKNQFMLYVLALIENGEHQFLVTRRALDKKWAPGAWEIPGGGVLSGETSLQAVCREVKEETGLDVSGCAPEIVYSYCNEDAESGDNYFADIYLIRRNFRKEDITIQRSEVIDMKAASWEEIEELHRKDSFLHFERISQALKK